LEPNGPALLRVRNGPAETLIYVTVSHRLPTSGFDRFDLAAPLLRGVAAAGFSEPRPIQDETIPAALDGRDVLGLAQTGTGKTAAFALPILDRLLEDSGPGPRALVVAPTRELASQIDAEFRLLARYTRLSSVTVYGGVSARGQMAALRRRPDVVIACPGRLLDLHGQGAVRLDRIQTLVLDEADHMFDMGFLPDIRRILAALPRRRQNLLFSATMPRAIRGLADDLLRDPHVAELSHSTPAATIEHALYPVAEGRKQALLERILSDERAASTIVFTRTKHRARRLAEKLDRAGHRAVALQGNMSQSQRDRAMRGFRGSRFDVLVATDIAARGIDVTKVSHVINFDVPTTPEAYTHRIGRTGRADNDGTAATFITGNDRAMVKAIERNLGEAIPRCELPGFAGEACSEDRPRAHRPRARARTGGSAARNRRRPRGGRRQGRR
jgi:ATP-dependent RNA helicase RhlE